MLEIIRELKDYEVEEHEETDIRPILKSVIPEDRDELFFQAFKDEFTHIDIISKSNDVTVLIDFALNMRTDKYKNGQKIFGAGDRAVFFYVIKQGSVKFCFDGLPELSIVEIGEGSYFGEWELMDRDDEAQRSYSCYSNEEDTVILKISKEIFLDIFINRDRKNGEDFKKVAKARSKNIEDGIESVQMLI